jgi:hypothetical protein
MILKMLQGWKKYGVAATAWVVLFSFDAMPMMASDDGLKFIHNQGGGEIVYGPVRGQTTLPGAMGFMLKQVHAHFSDKPQVGKFFRTKGSTDSIATSFTLTAKTNGSGPISGLVIVAMPPGQQPSAALIYDQAERFKTTASPMMKKLNEAWHADAPQDAKAAIGRGSVAHARPLHSTVFPDNSGSIGLPEGWQITTASQGMMFAQGPNNESFLIGSYIPVMDPGDPQQRQMIQMETQGGRVPLPGNYVAAPYGMPAFKLLQTLSAQTNAKQHKPAASIELMGADDLGKNCTYFKTHVDSHDGKGALFSGITMCIQPPFARGLYAVTINQATLPDGQIDQEKATFQAMYASYKTNDAVINAESRAAIDTIHAIGERAKIYSDASNAAWEIHQQGQQNQQQSFDKRSQAFENYLLDQTVVQDNQRNERGTVYNQYADSLVKADPNRFQYVNTQDYLKGIDY